MIKVNIQDAKVHLSRYLKQALDGERVILCRRNVPVAEIRPLAAQRTEPRPIGLAEGTFDVPDSFFEPLSDDLLAAFEGGDE